LNKKTKRERLINALGVIGRRFYTFATAVAFLAFAGLNYTRAYLTDTAQQTNTFAVGNLLLHIEEGNDANDPPAPWSDGDPRDIAADAIIPKAPKIINDGYCDAWFRTVVTVPTFTDADGATQLVFDIDNWSVNGITTSPTDWAYAASESIPFKGVFVLYYQHIVRCQLTSSATGDTETTTLFTQVSLNQSYVYTASSALPTIQIYAEGVQTFDNDEPGTAEKAFEEVGSEP
jgi:hypothetical protein